jgi:hypothetical protein
LALAGAATDSPEASRESKLVPSVPMSSTELPACPPLNLENEDPLFEVARPIRVWKFPFASIVLPE